MVYLVSMESSPQQGSVSENDRSRKVGQPPSVTMRRLGGAPGFRRLRGGRMARIWIALEELGLLRRALPWGGASKNMGAPGHQH